jgi:hypothetical protein
LETVAGADEFSKKDGKRELNSENPENYQGGLHIKSFLPAQYQTSRVARIQPKMRTRARIYAGRRLRFRSRISIRIGRNRKSLLLFEKTLPPDKREIYSKVLTYAQL